MKRTILLTNRYDGKVYDMLVNAIDGRFRLLMPDKVDQNALEDIVSEADYLLASGKLPINRKLIEKATKLKMIQRTGVGLDKIDLDALAEFGIPLYVNQGVNSTSVAEYAVMLMLSILKNSAYISNQMRLGNWDKQKNGIRTHELAGKTVGIVGLGNIGKKVARMLSAFECKVLYYDKYRASSETEEKYSVEYCSFDEMLGRVDILSLHCPYNGEYLIAAEQIAMIKDGIILINTARGGLIKEEDLIYGLKSGKIAFCGLDTFEEEPLSKDSELRKLDNVMLSPHVAGLSYESYERMLSEAIKNIWLFDSGNLKEIEEYRKN